MSDLFNLPEETPPWKALAESRGIWTKYDQDNCYWTAQIDWFNAIEHAGGDTEKLAIEALTLRLRLNEKGNDEQN